MKLWILLVLLVAIVAVHAQDSSSSAAESASSTKPKESTTAASTSSKKKSKKPSKTCAEHETELDVIIKKVLLIDYDKFPSKLPEIESHCSLGNKIYKKFKAYSTQCLTGLSKQLLSIFLRGVKKLVRNICTSPVTKANALKPMNCATESSVTGWNHCMHAANRQFAYISKNVTDSEIFSYVCCMYATLETCVDTKLANRDGCVSKPKANEYFRSMIDTALSELMDFVCPKWDSKSCAEKNKEGVELLKKLEDSDYKLNNVFLIGPLLELVPRLTL